MQIIKDIEFEEKVLKSDIPVLVDFYADWCGPCRMLAPTIDKISTEYEGKIKVLKVNVDNTPELAAKYGISSIPTLVVIKDGSAVKVNVGFISLDEIKSMIDSVL